MAPGRPHPEQAEHGVGLHRLRRVFDCPEDHQPQDLGRHRRQCGRHHHRRHHHPAARPAGGRRISAVGLSDMLAHGDHAQRPAQHPRVRHRHQPGALQAMHAISPYRRVQDGKAYPAVIVTTGANDPRVEAWLPGKFARDCRLPTPRATAAAPCCCAWGLRGRPWQAPASLSASMKRPMSGASSSGSLATLPSNRKTEKLTR